MQLSKPRVVIVGAGFGGLSAAKALKNTDVDVVVIDKNNHHLFQPLLYQVATAALSPGDIAQPIRTELRGNKNVQVILDEVKSIDKENSTLELTNGFLDFDYLILAPGNRHSYFGNDEWEKHAPGLKDLNDAIIMREKILKSFEKAERNYKNKEEYRRNTSFVIVGGGPTGVELAGAIAEIARKTILKDFPLIKAKDITIKLIDGADSLLTQYDESLSNYTRTTLEKMGVEVILNTMVKSVEQELVITNNGEFESSNIIWAAGNTASPLLKTLDTDLDRAGRALVNPDMSIVGYDNIFVIGDASYLVDANGKTVPGIAPAAMQQARYVADLIVQRKKLNSRKPFKYLDKGSMATIGRAKAIAQVGKLKFKGFIAWMMWGIIHIMFLIDFRNRLKVMTEWLWYYITFKPGASLIFHNETKEKEKVS
jgi:NADH:quinone reductase (non-electrogenic)